MRDGLSSMTTGMKSARSGASGEPMERWMLATRPTGTPRNFTGASTSRPAMSCAKTTAKRTLRWRIRLPPRYRVAAMPSTVAARTKRPTFLGLNLRAMAAP